MFEPFFSFFFFFFFFFFSLLYLYKRVDLFTSGLQRTFDSSQFAPERTFTSAPAVSHLGMDVSSRMYAIEDFFFTNILSQWDFSLGKFDLLCLGKASCDRVALPNLQR